MSHKVAPPGAFLSKDERSHVWMCCVSTKNCSHAHKPKMRPHQTKWTLAYGLKILPFLPFSHCFLSYLSPSFFLSSISSVSPSLPFFCSFLSSVPLCFLAFSYLSLLPSLLIFVYSIFLPFLPFPFFF